MLDIQIRATIGEPWRRCVDLGIYAIKPDGLYILDNCPLVKVKEGDSLPPSMSVSIEAAQALMDSLWQCGLRPTEGTGSAGALAATQAHLADMRKLVFDYLARPPIIRATPGEK